MLLNCLLSAYPENGLYLYNSLDYWQCRELLDVSNNARISSEDKNQQLENHSFNTFLDKYANKKFNWLDQGKQLNLWEVKEETINSLQEAFITQ